MTSTTSKEYELTNPEDVISSIKFHPSKPNLLLSSSWDKTVKFFNLESSNPTEPVQVYPHPSPILDISFGSGKNEGKAYTGSLDRGIREIDLESSTTTTTNHQTMGLNRGPNRVISTHEDAVKCVHYSTQHDILITGSWDRSVILQDPRLVSNSSATNQFDSTKSNLLILPNLPSKVYSLDTSDNKLVVAMGNRKIWIWDLRKLNEVVERVKEVYESRKKGGLNLNEFDERILPPPPSQERESSLKFMTRSIKCMPNGQGYTSTSIEGRVAVEFFDPSPEIQSKKYAFKCHRQTIDKVDTIYPVNALAFHPQSIRYFATGGGDSMVSIWDSAAKKRLRQLPKYPASISSLAFNCDGSKLAIACSLIEEEGTVPTKSDSNETQSDEPATANLPRNAIFIRSVVDESKNEMRQV
ncbi:WD40-repeat-containing domain protein [Melampsora americana]|nr:WD40-repeat-containing domain protein [Melampsora americana]